MTVQYGILEHTYKRVVIASPPPPRNSSGFSHCVQVPILRSWVERCTVSLVFFPRTYDIAMPRTQTSRTSLSHLVTVLVTGIADNPQNPLIQLVAKFSYNTYSESNLILDEVLTRAGMRVTFILFLCFSLAFFPAMTWNWLRAVSGALLNTSSTRLAAKCPCTPVWPTTVNY